MNGQVLMSAIKHASAVEECAALIATTLSEGRRRGVRLISGERRNFSLSPDRLRVHIPFPSLSSHWTLRSITCGVALQCSPSKEHIDSLPLEKLTRRQLAALSVIEGGVAVSWVVERWPGLGPEFQRLLPNVATQPADLNGPAMLALACELASKNNPIPVHPLLGELAAAASAPTTMLKALHRIYGRMPWSSKKRFSPGRHTIPVGGDGNVQNPNLPPPSHPDEEEPLIRTEQRAGVPYPEWNVWTQRFLPHHVAVLESRHLSASSATIQASSQLRRWFEAPTHRAMRNKLEDGSDLDVDQYIDHFVNCISGSASDSRVFRDLLPANRDVTTALLLDGSASLGAHQGQVFQLELACADALSRAMTTAGERHGVFVFSGHTRHRVKVMCLKDFHDHQSVMPDLQSLSVGGYTRLGAPIRHLTHRLMAQPSERRLLIIIGDGMMSDEGYEGHYAWADVAHAVEEAEESGVFLYYIGVGPARTDPLPNVFGAARSTRISRASELPRVLAHVHHQLVAA